MGGSSPLAVNFFSTLPVAEHPVTAAPSAVISDQPRADELRFPWGLPSGIIFICLKFCQFKKVFRKVDAVLYMAVGVTLSLRSFFPTYFYWYLNPTITPCVSFRAVSSGSNCHESELCSLGACLQSPTIDRLPLMHVCDWHRTLPGIFCLQITEWFHPWGVLRHISPHIPRQWETLGPKASSFLPTEEESSNADHHHRSGHQQQWSFI